MPPIIAAAIAHPIIAAGAAAAVGAGAAKAGGLGSKDGSVDAQFLQNPEYPHSQDARDLWWQKLQDWGKDPNYGAIPPDWDNIWSTVQNRVKQYYEGGPLAPGVKDRLKSSLARRGMSENPASDYLMAQTDAQQSNELNNLSTEQAVDKVNFANSGRSTWLNSLQNFQAQKPSGQWNIQTTPPQSNPWLDFIGNTGSTVASAGIGINGANAQSDILKQALNQGRMPQSFDPWSNANHLSASGAAFN